MADVLAAVDLTTVLTTIVPILVLGIGIAMAFKGSGLGKRAIKTA
ncbi:hypothetical protein [Parazoarcus communis]|nr:hypothetical protein [Parazoarcus communis]